MTIHISAGKILDAIHRSGARIVTNTEIFDIYEGEHIGEDKKSVAMRLTFQSDHTLKDEEISQAYDKVLDSLKNRVKAELRG